MTTNQGTPAETAWAALFDDLDAFLAGEQTFGDLIDVTPEALAPAAAAADRLLAIGRYAEAADLYEGCLFLFPDDVLTLCRLGTARHLAGNTPGAQVCFDLARQKSGDDPDVRAYVRETLSG